MKIRMAEERDLEGIKSLLLQVLTVHHKGRPDIFKPDSRKYTDNEIIDIIHNEKTPVLIAEGEDGGVMPPVCVLQMSL